MTAPSPQPSALRGEIRSLTGLRIVAAMWVVAFHFSFTPGDTYTRYWAPFRPIVQDGALGVDLFYVLSGFVITLTYVEAIGRRPSWQGTARFYWARLSRVWPVYAVVTSLYGVWLVWKASWAPGGLLVWQNVQPQVDVPHWIEQLAMVQLWHRPFFDGSSWVGPAWSVSAEWAAYAAFPLLALLLWRLRNARPVVNGSLAVLCMVPLAYQCWHTGNPYYPWSWVARIAGGFLAGAATCLAVRRIPRTPRVERAAAAAAVLVVAEMLVAMGWGWWRGHGRDEYGGVLVVLFPVLVGALALSTRGISRVLASAPLVHGGRISYSLYLVHVPLLEIFWTGMQSTARLAPGSALGEALVPQLPLVALLLAHLAYRFVEEPARRWLRGSGPGRPSRVGTPARAWRPGRVAAVEAVGAEQAGPPALGPGSAARPGEA